MPNERNVRTQQMLRDEGLYKGKLDGIIGPATRRALELHNKQQYQPLPRPRPTPGTLSPEAIPTLPGGPGAEATGRVQMIPQAMPMPPMPDSTAEIMNPSYGGPKPETAAGIRGGVNAAAGRELLVDPLRPAYAPGFAATPAGTPQDDFNLRNEIAKRRALGTLGQILSEAVSAR